MIVGLGNLGNKYHGTRHNGIVMNTIKSKALVGIGSIGEVPILVVKPQAYMNYSVEAVCSHHLCLLS
ncbi:putative aminoacyl-tRNA hydrolase [Rosa chinensis]|uniref:Putative aminoacyl-tRNA hydrolase n=1 Tax=Rosa chinensis TaxID=74649 RepID=A0A2P6RDP6_ROSCH|nr:putative aminoacyl-tRNA hydrolase [Rosa chinensis]